MLALELESFHVELKEGAIKNVGPSNKSATAKLFDVEECEVREFGDKRVKCVFEDGEGNELQVALFPEQVRALREGLEGIEAEGRAFD
jgi:hypothetical protein